MEKERKVESSRENAAKGPHQLWLKNIKHK
jgi:hypothetical protein